MPSIREEGTVDKIARAKRQRPQDRIATSLLGPFGFLLTWLEIFGDEVNTPEQNFEGITR